MSDADRKLAEEMARVGAEVEAWTRKNEADGGCCDFCSTLVGSGPHAVFVTAELAESVSVIDGETLGAATLTLGYDPYWLACPGCAQAVRGGDPESLAAYVIEHRDRMRVGPIPEALLPEVRRDLVQLYGALYAGGLREVTSASPSAE
jgi:hypothetical protein